MEASLLSFPELITRSRQKAPSIIRFTVAISSGCPYRANKARSRKTSGLLWEEPMSCPHCPGLHSLLSPTAGRALHARTPPSPGSEPARPRQV